MKFKLFVLMASLCLLNGCTTAVRIGDNEEAWVAETTNFFYLIYGTQYYYCRSHKTEDGRNVEPKCYKASKYSSWTEADLPLDISNKKK